MKYCHNCAFGVEQVMMRCPMCEQTTFVHKKISAAETVAFSTSTPSNKGAKSSVVAGKSSNAVDFLTTKVSLEPDDLNSLIKAVNRTTHAIRALVLFVFIQLSFSTFAYFTYQMAIQVGNENEDCSFNAQQFGVCPPNGFLVFLAAAIWIGGVVFSSKVGWQEIEKSRI